MGTLTEKAVQNHKNWYSCSASVLCAFAAEAGLGEQAARKLASPMASGWMGKCGAVLAAESVLREKYGAGAEEKIEALEREFVSRHGSAQCRDLMGSCRRCVTDAAAILETLI